MIFLNVAERHLGDRRQTAELRHVRQKQRKMADESALREGLLTDGRGAQHGVEQLPVVDDGEDGFLRDGLALLDGEAAAQFQNQAGDVDFAGTHVFAVAALDARP